MLNCQLQVIISQSPNTITVLVTIILIDNCSKISNSVCIPVQKQVVFDAFHSQRLWHRVNQIKPRNTAFYKAVIDFNLLSNKIINKAFSWSGYSSRSAGNATTGPFAPFLPFLAIWSFRAACSRGCGHRGRSRAHGWWSRGSRWSFACRT